jgi:pentatricopeptide repeat protein
MSHDAYNATTALALYQAVFKEVQNFITLACNGNGSVEDAKYCWNRMRDAHLALDNLHNIRPYLQHHSDCSVLTPTASDKRGYKRLCNCGFSAKTGLD